jgi:hypothetical protein
MIITYDTKLRLQTPKFTTEPEFALSAGPGSACVSLNTKNFRVEYKDGLAEMYLSRNLTAVELRQLGEAALALADAFEKQKDYVVMQSNGLAPTEEMPAVTQMVIVNVDPTRFGFGS